METGNLDEHHYKCRKVREERDNLRAENEELRKLVRPTKEGWIILKLETPKHKAAVAVDTLVSRLRLRPDDINGPSRMDMLREREEAANEIERQAELIRELQAAMMEAKTGFSLAYDAASKGLNDEVLLHCGAGEARLSKFDR